jgi:short-subunit dehydrogenase
LQHCSETILRNAFLVSRSVPPSLALQDGVKWHWIEADLSREDAPARIRGSLETDVLDVLIHNVGIWQRDAFTDNYDFETVSDAETREILRVSLESVITVTRAVLDTMA